MLQVMYHSSLPLPIGEEELCIQLAKLSSLLRWEDIPEIIIAHGSLAEFTLEPNTRHPLCASVFCHPLLSASTLPTLSAFYFLTIAMPAFSTPL